MPKLSKRYLSPIKMKLLIDSLWEAICCLQNKKEVRQFFSDLLTEMEVRMLAKRLGIAERLLEGKLYTEIMEELKVINRTVAEVNKKLKYGRGGYQMVIERLQRNGKS